MNEEIIITLDTKMTVDILKDIEFGEKFIDWFIKQELENCSFIELVEELVDINNRSSVIYIFYKCDIDMEILDKLSKFDCLVIKIIVARHPNTYKSTLKYLMNDKNKCVKELSIKNLESRKKG